MTPFKERMNLYRAYRELNPDKNYWDWKASMSQLDNDWGYQEWKRGLPENLRHESPDYDLYGAYKAGMQPVLESDGTYHLGSRDPLTGRILKRKGHPTYLAAVDAEKAAGYDVYEGDDGETYSKAPLPNEDVSGWLAFKDYYNSNELGAKERQQLRSWYRRRKAYAERTGNTELLLQLKDDGHIMQSLFGDTQSYESKYYTGGRSYTNVNLDDVPVNIVSQRLLGPTIGGLYTPPRTAYPKGLIEIPNDFGSSDLLHEYSHVLNNDYETLKKISDIALEHGGVTYFSSWPNPEYWASPAEIHSRLQELRNTHGISPQQKVTREDLQKMRKSGKSQHAILDYFADDDLILDLLNRVAEAGDVSLPADSKKPNVLATKDGGMVPAMLDGGSTVEDYITQQILAVREKAYQNSLDRTMPRVPYQGGLKNTISKEQFEADKIAKQTSLQRQLDSLPKQLNPATGQYSTSFMYKHVEDALTKLLAEVDASTYQDTNNGAILPSCIYTATDNYGELYLQPSTVAFMQQAGKNGFREIPIGDVKKGDIVIRSEDGQNHGMIFDGYDAQGRRLYNHSNGGHTAEAIRKHAKYPATDDMLKAYEFVGTAKDSARWISEYEKLQNAVPAMQDGGENKPLQDPTIKTITFPDGSTTQTLLPWANQQGLLNTPIADMFNPVNDIYDVVQVGKDAIEGNWADVGAGLVLAAMPKWMEKVGDAVKPYYRLLHKKASLKFGAPNVEFYENLVRDVMTRPTLTIQARREGRYPLTYQERRDYLENAHFHGDRAQNAVISNTLNAFDQRQMLESGIHVDTHPFAVDAIAKYAGAYTFNGRSYLNFSDRSSSIGVSYYPYWNIPNHVSLRRNRHSNILPNISAKQDKDLWALDEVVGHEVTHGMMARSGLHNDLAQHGGMLLLLDSDDAWQQLPTEVHAEFNGMRGALGLPRFSLMSQTHRDKFAKVFSERFNISLDAAKDVLEMADKF